MSHRDHIAAALQAARVEFTMDRTHWISANLVRCADYQGVPTAFVSSGLAKPWNGVVDAVHWLAHTPQHVVPWGRVRVAIPADASAVARDAVATVARAGNQAAGLAIELASYTLDHGKLQVTPLSPDAPDFGGLAKVNKWAQMLGDRAAKLAPIPPIGPAIVVALGSRAPSFRWYRNASERGFSGRVGGLECCRLEDGDDHISIGGRRFGAASLSELAAAVAGAARRRAAPGPGKGSTGLEALLESGVLRGAAAVVPKHPRFGATTLAPLAPDEPPLQLPALFGLSDRKRHIDAILRDGAVPWVVELKVASGGQGQYYRHAIAQAVLYRDFIRSATALHPWFHSYRLAADRCEAAIAFPELRGRAGVTEPIRTTLLDTAGFFGVGVAELAPWPELHTRCLT